MKGGGGFVKRYRHELAIVSITVAIVTAGAIAYYYSNIPSAGFPSVTETPQVSGLKDQFGISMLFETIPEGREWFIDPVFPPADDIFEVRDQTIKRLDDGYWYAEGNPPDFQTRILIKSPEGMELWKNVELTGYFRVLKTYGVAPLGNESARDEPSEADYAIQAYARGGIHSNQLMKGLDGKERSLSCVGSAYKGKIYFDGGSSIAKEIGHPVYASERFREVGLEKGSSNATSWTRVGEGLFEPLVSSYPLQSPSRWIGIKVVIYDYKENGIEYAKIQTYIDDDADDGGGRLIPSNNWRLLSDVSDKGDWAADPTPKTNNTASALDALIAKCGNPFTTRDAYSGMIITWFGHPDFIDDPLYRPITNAVSFRWDYAGAEFAYLSAREIGGIR